MNLNPAVVSCGRPVFAVDFSLRARAEAAKARAVGPDGGHAGTSSALPPGSGAWTGHDLTLDWRTPLGLESGRVAAGVYNVTDAKLSTNTANPFVTDGTRAAGWGRTFFVTLNMRF